MSRPSAHARAAVVASLLLLAVDRSGAESVTLTAVRDNTLYEDAAESNGAGAWLFAGRTGESAGSIRRGLLAFDLTAIPAGATVGAATLTLSMSRTASAAGARTVSLHRLLADWGEGTSDAGGQEGAGAAATAGDATWTQAFTGGAAWSAPGGDYASAASASQSVGGVATYTWSGAGLVADVQAWVDDPADNLGWAVVGDESTTRTAKRFDSRQNPTAANRPRLTVDYTVPAANRAPVVAGAPADLALTAGGASAQVALGAVFSDPDGDALVHATASSDTAVAAVAVDGGSLAVTPRAAGTATVEVTATDPAGASARVEFDAVVAAANRAPVVAEAPGSLRGYVGAALATISLDTVFTDADGDALTYGAVAQDSAIVALTVEGGSASVAADATGTTTVTLSATDPGGLSASVEFVVEVLALPGDFDGNDAVDFDDFFAFADHFGSTTADPAWDDAYDLVANGAVDFDDFFAFADHFGRTKANPPPLVAPAPGP